MTKSQLKQLTDYIKDLAEGLVEWDYDHISMQAELPKIYETIKLLMDETFKTKDQDLKPVLAYMEMKLRKCKDHIEKRLAVRNGGYRYIEFTR